MLLCIIWLQNNSVVSLQRIAGGFVYCSSCHPLEEKELINDTIMEPPPNKYFLALLTSFG